MLILNGISTDMACMKKDAEAEKKAIMDFICKCGLVGMTTAPSIALKLIDYEARDSLEDAHTGVYHKVMASFDGNVPSYHIELHDQPVLVWDFHSLLLGIQMMLAFALTDESKPLHLCRYCMKPFFAKRKDSKYCSPKCRSLAKSGKVSLSTGTDCVL